MKKLATLMIGLGLVLGTTATVFARQDTSTTKKKSSKKKKTDTTKKDGGSGL